MTHAWCIGGIHMKVISLFISFLVLALLSTSLAFASGEAVDQVVNPTTSDTAADVVVAGAVPATPVADVAPCASDVASASDVANDQSTPCTPVQPQPPVITQPQGGQTSGNGDTTPNTSGRRRNPNNETVQEPIIVQTTQAPAAENVVAPTPALATNPRSGSSDPTIAPGAFFVAPTVGAPAAGNNTPAPSDNSPLTGLISTAANPLVGIGLLVVLGGLYVYTRRK